ncbi:MAG: FAD-dependent oxidoreductase [Verrucomicrobiota bacterium]|jgi:ferredoxin
MSAFTISIDGKAVEAAPGQTVLQAARQAGLDIPTLCHLEKCGPLTTCQVCLVKVAGNGQGRLAPSCATPAVPGMVIESETEEVHEARRTALELLFSDHVGDCLSPCHRLCPLQLNIPAMIRQIQAGRLDEAVAIMRQALPLAGVLGRLCHHPCEQGCRRGVFDEPAAVREMERFLTEHDFKQDSKQARACLSERAVASRRSVVVVGAGPGGLTAAHDLARRGHAVTVIDRNAKAGGKLREVPEGELPAAVLEAEVALLAGMGIDFKTGIELGNHVTLDGLRRGFDAILITVGELAQGDGGKLGVAPAGGVLKADPSTCRLSAPNIFAAGACVKPVKQLVRAMAEGRAAAECVHRFLRGQPPRRPEKPFSSILGRLEPGELREFLRSASQEHSVAPCARCSAISRGEAMAEAARCLHCDCRSSGNCLLQHYAQVYGADASRFRSERRPFTQQLQPGGVIFEPGKCILCGICVRLTEMAAEPLGLTFIGRGFEVRVAGPFDRSIEEGLGAVAEECVRHCPTGALVFADKPSSVPTPAPKTP